MAGTMIRHIARKELREIVRDGRLRLLAILVAILAMTALAFGVQQTLRAQHQREHAVERATGQWEEQGEKNPHVAAHYGTHVFAPMSVVTAIDPGVSPYLGRSIEIKAHQRTLATHSAAEESGGMNRLGSFTVASVFLLLIPLLIIAVGYGLWSRERERGTLRQVLSTGVRQTDLFWGKTAALAIALSGLLVPAGAIIVAVLWGLSSGDGDTIVRLALLAFVYGLYFSIFSALTLAASALARTSSAALLGLVALWGFVCLVMPRAATELASRWEPLPSRAQLARDVGHSLQFGLSGDVEREVVIEAKIADALEEKGFSEDALLLFADESVAKKAEMAKAALALRFASEWEDEIFDHHMSALDDRIEAQEAVVDWAAFLSPFVATRTLSATLSGTDFAHHRHFTDYAETWRQAFVASLDAAFTENAGEAGWDYKAGPELWKRAPAFAYVPPEAPFGLRVHWVSLLALLSWWALSLGLSLWAARRVKVV